MSDTFLYLLFFLAGVITGIYIHDLYADEYGIAETEYCKEIKIDTLQYDVKNYMYKFSVEIIR